MDPHQTRLVRLLENGCEDRPMLIEAIHSCVKNTEQRELHAPLVNEDDDRYNNNDNGASGVLAAPTRGGGGDGVDEDDGGAVASSPLTSSNNAGPLDFVVAASQNMTPLEIAILTQNTAAVELLLQCGAQPDHVSGLSCTALCKVCYTFPANIAMIRALLEHGANPDATTNNDTSSASCLIISVVKDNIEAVKALLEFGGDVSYEWKGANALSMALDFKKLDVVELLENHEYRRAQDNRWKRFTHRRQLEESRKLQQQALHKQVQLEAMRQSMLKKTHSSDPMVTSSHSTSSQQHNSSNVGGGGGGGHHQSASAATPARGPAQTVNPTGPAAAASGRSEGALAASSRTQPPLSGSPSSSPAVPLPAASLLVVERSGTSPPRDAFSAGMLEAIQAHATAVHTPGVTEDVVSAMSNMDWIIPQDDLEVICPISSGAHGEVFKGRLKSLDELVAVKKFPFMDQKSRDCFRQEVTMLSKFRHENIVMFKGAVLAPDMCCIVSELCVENLMNRLTENPYPIPWPVRVRWARDIAKAMNYLHSRVPPIVHRDLKSLNILIDQSGNVKLCDFGMARTKEHTYIATKHIAGSPSWMAPEVLRGDDFNELSDIYAFGVVMWELLTRKVPWADKTMAQLVGLVGFAGHRLEVPAVLPPEAAGCPPGFVQLMQQCWLAPDERPKFKQIRAALDSML